MWRFDGNTWLWISGNTNSEGVVGEKGVSSPAFYPKPRFTFAHATDKFGGLYIFGGSVSGGILNDLWYFRNGSWAWLAGDVGDTNKPPYWGDKGVTSVSNNPGGRAQCFGWFANGSFWIFGTTQGYWSQTNDLWRCDAYPERSNQQNTNLNSKSSEDESRSTVGAAVAGVAVGLVAVATAAFGVYVVRSKSHRKAKLSREEEFSTFVKQKEQVEIPQAPLLKGIEIKHKLGSGNFGEVYLGLWNSAPVAAKKLRETSGEEEFRKELYILRLVGISPNLHFSTMGGHPHVVQFLGTFTGEDKQEYMILEYCRLGSLLDFLRSGRDVALSNLLDM